MTAIVRSGPYTGVQLDRRVREYLAVCVRQLLGAAKQKVALRLGVRTVRL